MGEYSEAFVAFDVAKRKHAVAIAESGWTGEVRFLGEIENSVAPIERVLKRLAGRYGRLHVCFEAGPTGYELYRHIRDHDCMVVAPALIPKRPGEHVKTNRRDVITLARLHRAGELTAVWVPDAVHEAVRDLVRHMGKLESLEELFAGRHFDRDVIILCVRWYLRFKLSLRDLVEMMGERGLSLAHTTIMRWVRHYTLEFEKRWRHYALAVGQSWRVDETYVKIRGEWCYLYRAVDRVGRTVDCRLSPRRDVAAAKAFLRKAINNHQHLPQTIRLDGYAASHRAVGELKADGSLPTDTKQRSSKYLNNLIEQDHRSVKQRIPVMLGFKQFHHAAITIAGIELMHRIRKGQFGLRRLGV